MTQGSTAWAVGAAAVYPHDANVVKKLSFCDRYDEPYTLAKVVGNQMWLPRNLAPKEDWSSVGAFDYGTKVQFENNFIARNPEQHRVVMESAKLFLSGQSHIVEAPTGFGKTIIGLAVAAVLGVRVLVITTKEDIIDQWVAAAKMVMGLKPNEIGVWRAKQTPQPHHKVVVGLVQSITKGPDRYGLEAYQGFGLVICDEVHRMGAAHFIESMWWLSSYLRMGLSATTYRKDGRDRVFTSHIGHVLVKAEMEVMIPKIMACDTEWKVPNGYDGRPLKVTPGKMGHVTKVMGASANRNAKIVMLAKAAYVKGRNNILFADSLSHLDNLYEALAQAGIPKSDMGYYVGLQSYEGPQKARKAAREKAKTRKIILATYAMASEATDIPWLDTCILCTPRSDVVQIVGRIRREYENKGKPVVFDMVDMCHGAFIGMWKKRCTWYHSLGMEIATVV